MTKGKIHASGFFFCCRVSFLSSNAISATVFETRVSGHSFSVSCFKLF